MGRHDWSKNWPQFKSKYPDYKEKVKAWLDRFEIDHDPQGLVDYLDGLVTDRVGRWR